MGSDGGGDDRDELSNEQFATRLGAVFQQCGVVAACTAQLETVLTQSSGVTVEQTLRDVNAAGEMLDQYLDAFGPPSSARVRALWRAPEMVSLRRGWRAVASHVITHVEKHRSCTTAILVQLHQLAARLGVYNALTAAALEPPARTCEIPASLELTMQRNHARRRHHRVLRVRRTTVRRKRGSKRHG